MHKVRAKGILSAGNGMNVYRGCTHGCIYCDSRSACYQMNHAFEDIEVKENAPELLEAALRSKRKRCMISTGAMCDPYLHAEKELLITRRCLELISRYEFGAAVLTKSDLIMRERGIPTVVWFSPLLPFLNDTEENVLAIVDYARRAGCYGIISFGMGLTLREGDREYYYEALDRHFPGLKQRYIRRYGNNYELPSPDSGRLIKLFRQKCHESGLECDMDRIFAFLHEFPDNEQLTLFQKGL